MKKVTEKTKILVIRDKLSALITDAGVSFNEATVINISNDIDHVFHGCETYEDALQRIKELSKLTQF